MQTIRELAQIIAPDEAEAIRARLSHDLRLANDARALDLAVLLAAAYPAIGQSLAGRAGEIAHVARSGHRARDARTYQRLALTAIGDLSRGDDVRAELRRFAFREKLRVAARELLLDPGADVDVTARELADLADACIEVALREATVEAERRYGVPLAASGERCGVSILGMGKLGGRELNAGSDVDLLVLYETDEGRVEKDGVVAEISLHEYFTRVTQRCIANLEEATEDGVVWRVDMRLRPEGSRGPLVNSLAAAERYYETWGRTWERAALVRARPSAGDLAFGRRALEALAPFVWRRVVNPRLADEMVSLVARSRAEAGPRGATDLKIGTGGIREAEFFAQSLQLIWGGKEPTLRATGTLDALRRLRSAGLVTDREAREVGDAYLFLRRLEHRVHFATGLQTHALPDDPSLLLRIARSLGFASAETLLAALDEVRARVRACLAAITTSEGGLEDEGRAATERLLAGIEACDETAVTRELPARFGDLGVRAPDLARHLLSLGRRPDSPLGILSRELHPELPVALLDALADAADPEQAARLAAAFFQRFSTPGVYVRALADDRRALLRLTGLFGASAFLGEAAVAHPELVDNMMFGSGRPDEVGARRAVAEEVATLSKGADADELVGALRRAKRRATMEVGLADLAGEIDTRGATFVLSALADAILEEATRFAAGERGLDGGLAVLGMGKLGGRELGYGSDLDLFFVYDPSKFDGDPDVAEERYVRTAQRVLRLASAPHGEGPGYELDTRLRPSGNQGLLVVSLEAFARYHDALRDPRQGDAGAGPSASAQDWERQALIKARAVAGDAALGRAVLAIAERAAYERGAPPAERVHHLRKRMERELSGERTSGGRARYDVKLGRGGIVDVEFAVQWLQMKHGKDPRVRSADTETALGALEACGYLDAAHAASLREGYRTLRQIEQRLRVHHGTSATLLEEGAPGLDLLARRLGLRDSPRRTAAEALLARHVVMAREVRSAYLAVLGLDAG